MSVSVPEHTPHPAERRSSAHTTTSAEGAASQPDPAAVKTEPKSEPKSEPKPEPVPAAEVAVPTAGRADPTLRDVRLTAAAAETDWERLLHEPLLNGHAGGGDARLRVEDNLDEQVQSAIKSILNLPRAEAESAAALPTPPPPSRFNINASFFSSDEAADDSEALDEAVRSILL